MKSNNFFPPKYKKYSSRLKEITQWQAIRLKEMGYKNIYIANLLNIHTNTVSSWHKTYLINSHGTTLKPETTLVTKFGKLLPEEIEIISHFAIELNENGVKRSKIADLYGLSSGAVISGWINEQSQLQKQKICKPLISDKQNTNRKPYKSFTKRMKDIIQWQAIRLKLKGHDNSYISNVLNVNKSLISKYCKINKKECISSASIYSKTITMKFGVLSVKEKKMILSQISSLENSGIQRSDIAKIIGLSSGAVISGWQQENPGSNNKTDMQKVLVSPYDLIYQKLGLLKFQQYKKETKDLVKWQAIFLKKNGHKYSEISSILNIHTSTVSRWWNAYIKSGNKPKINQNSAIKNHFKKLTPEMKRVISLQILQLKDRNHTHKEIASILGFNNAALISRWLKNISNFTKSHIKVPLESPPIILPQIGLRIKNTHDTEESLLKDNKKPPLHTTKPFQESVRRKINTQLPSKPVANKQDSGDAPAYFSKGEKASTIVLKDNTKIIKAAEYSKYFNAEKLIKASENDLLECKKRAKKITNKAEKSAEIITKKIIKQAEKKARKQAKDLLAEKNIAATNSATNYLESLQENLPDIILSIINKFIENYDDRDFIIHTINTAISEINNKENIKIYVNSKVINEVKKRLHQIKYPNKKITLISDTSIKKKDCLIVTKLGVVNANLENQIKKIEKNLRASTAL